MDHFLLQVTLSLILHHFILISRFYWIGTFIISVTKNVYICDNYPNVAPRYNHAFKKGQFIEANAAVEFEWYQ